MILTGDQSLGSAVLYQEPGGRRGRGEARTPTANPGALGGPDTPLCPPPLPGPVLTHFSLVHHPQILMKQFPQARNCASNRRADRRSRVEKKSMERWVPTLCAHLTLAWIMDVCVGQVEP